MKPEEFTTYQTGVLQGRAYRVFRTFMSEHLKPHDLTVMDWYVLGLAFDYSGSGGAKVGQLAEVLNVEISLITTTLNKLEPQGVVERIEDEKDSRARRVVTTRKGEKKIKKIEKQLRKELDEWLEGVHDRKLAAYISTLQHLAKK